MRLGESELERLSLESVHSGGLAGGGWRTSPNAYNVPQTDPFFTQTPMRREQSATSSMKVMPPTPPSTNIDATKNNNNIQSSPFPLDMRAFEEMKKLYEERAVLVEV